MKKFAFFAVALSLITTSAFAAVGDIGFSGDSAQFLFNQLSSRSEGVAKSEAKSTLKSRIELAFLHDNIMICGLKHGWIFESYSCRLPDTNSRDIAARKIVSAGGEWSDAIEELSRTVNREAVLAVSGMSASRLFTKISQLKGKDKTFIEKTGITRYLKNKFVGVGISEIYCQKTTGRILGDSFNCLISNVSTDDSNARVHVITDPEQDRDSKF